MYDAQQKSTLRQLAWAAIESGLKDQALDVFATDDPGLMAIRGVFVTLKQDKRLRGCIGQISGVYPLAAGVGQMARQAAFHDPRFAPLSAPELTSLTLEISVLSLPEPLENVEEIVIGRHGLIIKKGLNQGVFLPQVPLEQGWDREAYLEALSLKAGLAPKAWQTAEILSFTAEVF